MKPAALKIAFLWLGITVCLPAVIGLTGCNKSSAPPATLAEAQQRYAQTRWYWAKTTATLTNLAEQGFQDYFQPKPGDQISLKSSNGSRILFTEFLPSSGLKAFTGMGSLQQLNGITQPIYHLNLDPAKVRLVGFGAGRMFRIEVDGPSDELALQDAIVVATNALRSIEGLLK